MPRKPLAIKPKPKQSGNLLLAVVRQDAAKFRSTGKPKNWFDNLCERSKKTSDELLALAKDWAAGGETRTLLPTRRDFYRFVTAKVVKISETAFARWLQNVESSIVN